MKILITGANGQLGRELTRKIPDTGFTVHAAGRQELDITDFKQVEKALKDVHPFLVINAAAYTHVDQAEIEKNRAFAVNKTGAANLARVCAKNATPLFQISTDYVFDGNKKRPYLEGDPISPLGAYGQSKAEGEIAIRSCLDAHIIVRTSWLYSPYGNNFVKTILRLGMTKESIQVVADQFGCPTCAAELAEALLEIARRMRDGFSPRWGTYHYCGQGATTWHGFAVKVLKHAKSVARIKTINIEPIKTEDFPSKAKRPAYSVLDCNRIKTQFGIIPNPWQSGLSLTVEQILCDPDSFPD